MWVVRLTDKQLEVLRALLRSEEHLGPALKGSIEAGKLADLVVLGRDPLREPASSLVGIPIERTMAGGRWVFEA